MIVVKPTEIEPLKVDDAEDPACVPMLWISKWVDYSDKYGLGYQLCDESVGVLFNDSTRLILCSSGEWVWVVRFDFVLCAGSFLWLSFCLGTCSTLNAMAMSSCTLYRHIQTGSRRKLLYSSTSVITWANIYLK